MELDLSDLGGQLFFLRMTGQNGDHQGQSGKNAHGSLEGALAALEKDHAFLLKGDVFTADVIETWVEYKRSKELDPLRLRPHPYEFALYYDA